LERPIRTASTAVLPVADQDGHDGAVGASGVEGSCAAADGPLPRRTSGQLGADEWVVANAIAGFFTPSVTKPIVAR
jgi:hypothetical protein